MATPRMTLGEFRRLTAELPDEALLSFANPNFGDHDWEEVEVICVNEPHAGNLTGSVQLRAPCWTDCNDPG